MQQNVCSECAKGKMECMDCCTSPFVESDPGFWMTLSDIARIVKKTGLAPDKFCRFVEVEDDEEDEDDEAYAELLYQGNKVILMNGRDKKCFFLSENGCSIFDYRPKMCRIHPFWFNEKGENIDITIEQEDKISEDDCFLTKSNYGSQDVPLLLGLIDETEEGMKECVRKSITEMKLHSKYKHELDKKPIIDVLKDNGFLD